MLVFLKLVETYDEIGLSTYKMETVTQTTYILACVELLSYKAHLIPLFKSDTIHFVRSLEILKSMRETLTTLVWTIIHCTNTIKITRILELPPHLAGAEIHTTHHRPLATKHIVDPTEINIDTQVENQPDDIIEQDVNNQQV